MPHFSTVRTICIAALIAVAGCSGEQKPAGGDKPAISAGAHDHPTNGPHGGQIIELGKEEYHVEMLHDDATGTVTFYVLDSKAKTANPIDAVELVINLKHDGMPEQFKVPAQRETTDPAGKSSRFVSTDKELAADLDAKGAEAELVVTMGGTQFRGALAHDHEGEENQKHKD